MSRVTSTALVAALVALAAVDQGVRLPEQIKATLPPEDIERKRNKADKKRAKRAARNLRIAAQQPTQRAAGE